MKQTAVEWLEEQLIKKSIAMKIMLNANNELVEQAKAMEKQQIINSFVEGADKGEMFNNEKRAFTTDAEQYYQENFKSE